MNFPTAIGLSLFLHFLLLSWWWLGVINPLQVNAKTPEILQVTILQSPSLPSESAEKFAEADQAAGGQQRQDRLTSVRTFTTPTPTKNFLEALSPYTEMSQEALKPDEIAESPEATATPVYENTPQQNQLANLEVLAQEVLAAEIVAREVAAEAARARAEARYLKQWFQQIQRIGNAESRRQGLQFTGEAQVRFRIQPNGRAQEIAITFISGGSSEITEITEIIKDTIAQIALPYPDALTLPAYQSGLWVDKIWEFSR